MLKVFALLMLFGISISGQLPDRTISITIDDLPVVTTQKDIKDHRELTRKLLGHIKKAKAPAIGFVNENKLYDGDKLIQAKVELLEMWLDAGLELGNHTYSHRSLNVIALEEYKADVLKGETVLRDLLAKRKMALRYFRHPFLQTGRTLEIKQQFDSFLQQHGYRIAPVSHDNADYIFSRAYDLARDKNDKKLMKKIGDAYVPYMIAKMDYWERQAVKLFGREISQILLIHANSINAEYFDDLARALKKRNYKFVSLETSLKDEAFTTPDRFVGFGGISWLHRWAIDKGKGNIVPDEPKVPEFVMKASGFESK